MRIGHGYDVHRLTAGRKLILGGVEIPFELGLEGHSDADVLLHAVMDALLGAAGLRDIGQHFPDTDPREAAFAFGDSANDLPMFQCVATPIAMGGSPLAVQQAAVYTTGTVLENGIQQGLRHFGLI